METNKRACIEMKKLERNVERVETNRTSKHKCKDE